MSANLNNNINITVTTDAAPTGEAGFGVPLWAGFESFAERVRRYNSAAEVNDDDELSASSKAAVAAAFAQSPCPAEVAVGRLDALVAQITDVVIGGTVAPGDIFNIVIDGVTYAVTADSDDAAADIAGKLRTAATADASCNISGATTHFIATAKVPGVPFTLTMSKTSSAGTITLSASTANTGVEDGLAEILDSDSDWYAFATDTIADAAALRAAAWAESNKKLYFVQSNDGDIITGGTSDLAYRLKALNYRRTVVIYHDDAEELIAFAWPAMVLATDPDEQSVGWTYKTLSGVTAEVISTTEKNHAIGKNCNIYIPFFGQASTWPAVTADGTKIDVVLTCDWVEARMEEALAALVKSYADTNLKIPYTDKGIMLCGNVARDVLGRGERAGHFTEGSSSVTEPKASEVSSVDKNARSLSFTWTAELAGAVETISGTGRVLVAS